ncbi:MAG: Lrp/AsnC family transcriptional regulator [Candidatus Bathyarchaeota archaeon]|nr:Lrp/AsnC family transcriptional regulator [Candidatus Bathyarchaeum tardum]
MISDEDKAILVEVQRLPLVSRPFFEIGKRLNLTEEQVLDACNCLLRKGIIRRFGVSLAHRKIGFVANPMTVLKVPKNDVDSVGAKIASFPTVSHCYAREGWDYNLFFMIHSKSVEEAKKKVKSILDEVNIKDYKIYFSSREFKKTSFEFINSEQTLNPERGESDFKTFNCS